MRLTVSFSQPRKRERALFIDQMLPLIRNRRFYTVSRLRRTRTTCGLARKEILVGMGLGHGAFLVNRNGQLHRISQAHFNGLLNGDPEITVPAPFIGESNVRYALAIYETNKRKPTAMIRVDYGILPLDPDGILDKPRMREQISILWRAWPPLGDDYGILKKEEAVVDGTRIFAKKRLSHECRWEPSTELQEEIRKSILAK